MILDCVLGECSNCEGSRRSSRGLKGRVVSLGIVCTLLFADFGEASFLKCFTDSMCTSTNPNYCCVAINQSMGMCKMKRGIGQQCFPEIKRQVLTGGGAAFNDCGCAADLTCAHVEKRNKVSRKKKRRRRYKHRCIPTPTEVPEVYEHHQDR